MILFEWFLTSPHLAQGIGLAMHSTKVTAQMIQPPTFSLGQLFIKLTTYVWCHFHSLVIESWFNEKGMLYILLTRSNKFARKEKGVVTAGARVQPPSHSNIRVRCFDACSPRKRFRHSTSIFNQTFQGQSKTGRTTSHPPPNLCIYKDSISSNRKHVPCFYWVLVQIY